MRKIAIIGGSGFAALGDNQRWEAVTTPFGTPSDALCHLTIAGVDVILLPRHGRGHHLSPSGVNYRANIFALKQAGVTDVISISAVGSLQEQHAPGDFVVVDQFIDRTKQRAGSFFSPAPGGDVRMEPLFGCVAHVSVAEPISKPLANALYNACQQAGVKASPTGTYLAMEGPQFSTKAESHLYRSWGADIIGMTNMPEAKLAREAQMAYATLAMVTDYDCWNAEHAAVSVEAVIAILQDNSIKANTVLTTLLPTLASQPMNNDPAYTALTNAIITLPDVQQKMATHPDFAETLQVLQSNRG